MWLSDDCMHKTMHTILIPCIILGSNMIIYEMSINIKWKHEIIAVYLKRLRAFQLGLERQSLIESAYCSFREPDSVPRIHFLQLTTAYNSSSRESANFLWTLMTLHSRDHTTSYIHTLIVSYPRLPRQLWVISVSHKTKWKDTNTCKEIVARRESW